MQIKSLSTTPIEVITECLLAAFQNYFVKMPEDVDFWKQRFIAARVNYDLSFGVFDKDRLVAFIIHGVDQHQGVKTAFNTGTGVLESYRGQGLVDKMYTFAFPKLKIQGVQKCMLEVITINYRAIKVYERIGFKKTKFLRCFNGVPSATNESLTIHEVDIRSLQNQMASYQDFYSWDHSPQAIKAALDIFKGCIVKDKGEEVGYFIINDHTKALIQIESFDDKNWVALISALFQLLPSIKINNVDGSRKNQIDAFVQVGLENPIDQYEMEMFI